MVKESDDEGVDPAVVATGDERKGQQAEDHGGDEGGGGGRSLSSGDRPRRRGRPRGTSLVSIAKSRKDELWEERLEELKKYREKHGHCCVPRTRDRRREAARAKRRRGGNRRRGRRRGGESAGDGSGSEDDGEVEDDGYNQLASWVHRQRSEFRHMQRGDPSSLTTDRLDALNALGFKWEMEKSDSAKWRERLEELKRFKAEHGHCNVPGPYPYLGFWVKNQRAQFRKMKAGKPSQITPERINALQELGFEFDYRYRNNRLTKSEAEGEESDDDSLPHSCGEGNTNESNHGEEAEVEVAHASTSPGRRKSRAKPAESSRTLRASTKNKQGSPDLIDGGSRRTSTARSSPRLSSRKRPRPSAATPSATAKSASGRPTARATAIRPRRPLEGEESDTSIDSPGEDGGERRREEPSWESMFYQLVVFKVKHGHANPPCPADGDEGDGGLFRWVEKQRRRYKWQKKYANYQRSQHHRTVELTDEQIGVLEHVGLSWSLNEEKWERRYRELCQFQLQHGHCNVPTVKSDLGRWVQLQRINYREAARNPDVPSKSMTDERRAKLNAIGFTWNVLPERVGWDGRYEELKQFHAEHGHCVVPQHYTLNKQLGKWVSKTRYEYNLKKRGTGGTSLTEERIARLEELGFWDGIKDDVVKPSVVGVQQAVV